MASFSRFMRVVPGETLGAQIHGLAWLAVRGASMGASRPQLSNLFRKFWRSAGLCKDLLNIVTKIPFA